jgi:hypothetical protein
MGDYPPCLLEANLPLNIYKDFKKDIDTLGNI